MTRDMRLRGGLALLFGLVLSACYTPLRTSPPDAGQVPRVALPGLAASRARAARPAPGRRHAEVLLAAARSAAGGAALPGAVAALPDLVAREARVEQRPRAVPEARVAPGVARLATRPATLPTSALRGTVCSPMPSSA